MYHDFNFILTREYPAYGFAPCDRRTGSEPARLRIVLHHPFGQDGFHQGLPLGPARTTSSTGPGPCGQFHQHFTHTFFVRKYFAQLFFYLHVTREKLPKRLSYEKCACKMLMKLTPGVDVCVAVEVLPFQQQDVGLYDTLFTQRLAMVNPVN